MNLDVESTVVMSAMAQVSASKSTFRLHPRPLRRTWGTAFLRVRNGTPCVGRIVIALGQILNEAVSIG